jgi:hypothetical protein
MKNLISKINKAIAAVLFAGVGGFAQEVETSEKSEKNPLRNKRNYKTSASVRGDFHQNPYGSLTEKTVAPNYKRKYSFQQTSVVTADVKSEKRKNYKRQYSN